MIRSALIAVTACLTFAVPLAADAAGRPGLAPVRATAVSRTARSLPSASSATALARFLNAIGARYAGPAAIGRMTVDVATPLRNAAGLRSYAREASTPASVYYRHFLTPAQIASAFGTDANAYATTAAYFRRYGLLVKPWSTRTMITLTGSSRGFERALGTRFATYQFRNRRTGRLTSFVAPSASVGLSAALGSVSLKSLVKLQLTRTHAFIGGPSVPVSSGFADGRVNGATVGELAQAYDFKGAYAAGYTGKGVNIGVIGTGQIGAQDVPTYRKTFNVPGTSTVTEVPVTIVAADSTPPPATGPCAASTLGGVSPIGDPTSGSSGSPTAGCNPEDIEAQLDTEQTAMLAYDANVLFYLAYNGSGCLVEGNPVGSGCVGPVSTSQGIDLTDDELMQAVNDNQADILSLSFGACEILETGTFGLTATPGSDATGIDPTIFQELATEGVAVFVSSGDQGSADCQLEPGNSDAPNVDYPGSDPNNVAVGGTTTPMLPSGVLSGPITSWGSQTKSDGAEGAGQSVDFTTPSFQMAESNVAAVCTMRCVPDVVQDADPFTGAAVIYDTGVAGGEMEVPVGGTSQAAPDMAAMWALVLSACEVTPKCGGTSSTHVTDPPGYTPSNAAPHAFRLGNPNFLWYGLADTSKPATVAAYHQTFYDIVFGDDGIPTYAAQTAAGAAAGEGAPVSEYSTPLSPGAVSAGPGWDAATGLGAPFARALIRQIVGV